MLNCKRDINKITKSKTISNTPTINLKNNSDCFIGYKVIPRISLEDSIVESVDSLGYKKIQQILEDISAKKNLSRILYNSLISNHNKLSQRIKTQDQIALLGDNNLTNHDLVCFDKIIYNTLKKYVDLHKSIESITIITGEENNFGEYPLVSYYKDSSNCVPNDLARHIRRQRFNQKEKTYFKKDPTVIKNIGFHRLEDHITLTIPLVNQEIYFADLSFSIKFSECMNVPN